MKTVDWFAALLIVTVAAAFAYAESYRTTSADLYEQSYSAHMMKQVGGYSAVDEERAVQYRRGRQVCDADHNCTDPPSQKAQSSAQRVHDAMTALHVPVLG